MMTGAPVAGGCPSCALSQRGQAISSLCVPGFLHMRKGDVNNTYLSITARINESISPTC